VERRGLVRNSKSDVAWIRGLHGSHYMVGLLRQADGAIEVERDAEVVTDSRVGNVACEHPALTENIVGVGKDDLRKFVARQASLGIGFQLRLASSLGISHQRQQCGLDHLHGIPAQFVHQFLQPGRDAGPADD
jgi:hypothetical protein